MSNHVYNVTFFWTALEFYFGAKQELRLGVALLNLFLKKTIPNIQIRLQLPIISGDSESWNRSNYTLCHRIHSSNCDSESDS